MSDLSSPPPAGRAPQRVETGGLMFEVAPLAPRMALRVGLRLVRLVGDPLAGLLSGAGLEVQGFKDDEGNPIRLQFAHVLTSNRAREALFGLLVAQIGTMDLDDLDDLVDELLVGQVKQHVGNGAWIPATNGEVLDNMVGTLPVLLVLLRTAFVVSLFPTSAGGDTSEDSQPAGT